MGLSFVRSADDVRQLKSLLQDHGSPAHVIAKIDRLYVEEGDEVTKGQVLARLDGDRLRLELTQSAANLQKLKRDYERNVDLKEKGLISTGDFDKIRYEMEALEASYNLAKLELDYTQIRAPITGRISSARVVDDRYPRPIAIPAPSMISRLPPTDTA